MKYDHESCVSVRYDLTCTIKPMMQLNTVHCSLVIAVTKC